MPTNVAVLSNAAVSARVNALQDRHADEVNVTYVDEDENTQTKLASFKFLARGKAHLTLEDGSKRRIPDRGFKVLSIESRGDDVTDDGEDDEVQNAEEDPESDEVVEVPRRSQSGVDGKPSKKHRPDTRAAKAAKIAPVTAAPATAALVSIFSPHDRNMIGDLIAANARILLNAAAAPNREATESNGANLDRMNAGLGKHTHTWCFMTEMNLPMFMEPRFIVFSPAHFVFATNQRDQSNTGNIIDSSAADRWLEAYNQVKLKNFTPAAATSHGAMALDFEIEGLEDALVHMFTAMDNTSPPIDWQGWKHMYHLAHLLLSLHITRVRGREHAVRFVNQVQIALMTRYLDIGDIYNKLFLVARLTSTTAALRVERRVDTDWDTVPPPPPPRPDRRADGWRAPRAKVYKPQQAGRGRGRMPYGPRQRN